MEEKVRLFHEAAGMKSFSVYPEIIEYPSSLKEYYAGVFLSFGTSLLGRDIIDSAQAASNPVLPLAERKQRLEDILLLGNKMIVEKDYNDLIMVFTGIVMETRAADALSEFYKEQGDISKATLYKRYGQESQHFKKIINQLHLNELSIYSFETYGAHVIPFGFAFSSLDDLRKEADFIDKGGGLSEAEIKIILETLARIKEPAIAVELIKFLALLSYVEELPIESSLSKKALESLSTIDPSIAHVVSLFKSESELKKFLLETEQLD